jgi:hypothetical protein
MTSPAFVGSSNAMGLIQGSHSPPSDAARRANGRQSRGPVSAQGKAHSSLNALRHGVLSQVCPATLQALEEDPAQLETLRAALWNSLAPSDEFEGLLVEEMVTQHWRLRRLRRSEAGMLEEERNQLKREREQRAGEGREFRQAMGGAAISVHLGLWALPDSTHKFAEILNTLRTVELSVRVCGFDADGLELLDYVYGPRLAKAQPLVRSYQERQKAERGKAKGGEATKPAQRECFLLELGREIKVFERQAELYRGSEVEITPALLDSRLLLPEKEANRVIRYERLLTRGIDRTLKQLLDWRRAKATFPQPPDSPPSESGLDGRPTNEPNQGEGSGNAQGDEAAPAPAAQPTGQGGVGTAHEGQGCSPETEPSPSPSVTNLESVGTAKLKSRSVPSRLAEGRHLGAHARSCLAMCLSGQLADARRNGGKHRQRLRNRMRGRPPRPVVRTVSRMQESQKEGRPATTERPISCENGGSRALGMTSACCRRDRMSSADSMLRGRGGRAQHDRLSNLGNDSDVMCRTELDPAATEVRFRSTCSFESKSTECLAPVVAESSTIDFPVRKAGQACRLQAKRPTSRPRTAALCATRNGGPRRRPMEGPASVCTTTASTLVAWPKLCSDSCPASCEGCYPDPLPPWPPCTTSAKCHRDSK